MYHNTALHGNTGQNRLFKFPAAHACLTAYMFAVGTSSSTKQNLMQKIRAIVHTVEQINSNNTFPLHFTGTDQLWSAYVTESSETCPMFHPSTRKCYVSHHSGCWAWTGFCCCLFWQTGSSINWRCKVNPFWETENVQLSKCMNSIKMFLNQYSATILRSICVRAIVNNFSLSPGWTLQP